MPINAQTKIVSVKDQLDNLESKFETLINDPSVIESIQLTHASLSESAKNDFKNFADSYTKTQRLSIEVEASLAIEDLKKATAAQTHLIETVSIAHIRAEFDDLVLKCEKDAKEMKRKYSLTVLAMFLTSIVTSIITVWLS